MIINAHSQGVKDATNGAILKAKYISAKVFTIKIPDHQVAGRVRMNVNAK
ncbi:MAG: hypothetical protein WA635_05590 [Gallionella sp.]